MEKSNNKRKIILRIAVVVVLIIAAVLIYIIPSWRAGAGNLWNLLLKADTEQLKNFILSYGPLAVVISIFLMIAQSVVAPIPAFFITLANAAVFGWWRGAVISWTGAMLGAVLCFFLARLFGRDLVVKITGKGALESVDSFFTKYSARAVFIARLLPFVPFDPISYGAGLTGMKVIPFLLATGLGQLPATVIYSYAGSAMLSGNLKKLLYGLCILMIIGCISMMLQQKFKKKRTESKNEDSKQSD